MTRFLHTADWHLGLRRHFLDADAQARYGEARLESVRAIGRIARAEGCEFVVVAGDVFDSNQLDRQTVRRALEAMADVPVDVYLLPGNHDAADAGSVYRSPAFLERKPTNVHVLADRTPVEFRPGVEIVGAPWASRHSLGDPLAAAFEGLAPSRATVRVVVGHGEVESPDRDHPATIALDTVRRALAERRAHYVALGDRHSSTSLDPGGRVWYAGSPEVTDFDEVASGGVLRVDLDPERCEVVACPTGVWRFERLHHDLFGPSAVAEVRRSLAAIPAKRTTVLKLSFAGTLTLRARAELEDVLAEARDVFASVQERARTMDLAVLPDEADLGALELAGFAREGFARLSAQARQGGEDGEVAADALALLFRLAGGGA